MNFTRTKEALDDEWGNGNEIKNEGVIDEEETHDPEKHASASFFPPESNKARVSSHSHLSLIFALLGNRGKQSTFFAFLRKLCRVSLAWMSEHVFFIWNWYSF